MSNISFNTFWYQTGAVPGNDRRDSYKYYPPDAPSEYMKILLYITNLSTPCVAVLFNPRGFAWAANYKESNLRLSTTSSVLFETRADGSGDLKLSQIAELMLRSPISEEYAAAFDESKKPKDFLTNIRSSQNAPYTELINNEIDALRKELSKVAERLLGASSEVCGLPDSLFPRTPAHLGELLKFVPDFISPPFGKPIYFKVEQRPQVEEVGNHARFLAGLLALNISRPDLTDLPLAAFDFLFGSPFDQTAFKDEADNLRMKMDKFGEIRKKGTFISWFAEYFRKDIKNDFNGAFGSVFERFKDVNYRRAFNIAICAKHLYSSTRDAFNFETLMNDWLKMWYASGFYSQKDAEFIENPAPLTFMESQLSTEINDPRFAEFLQLKKRELGYVKTKDGLLK